MAGDENFYGGSNTGLDSNYQGEFLGFEYRVPASSFGLTTDPRNANQLKAVADKISTGIKTIEFTGITPDVLESVPDQHLVEIGRLRKLTGVDLTFHGPIIEASGISKQGWDPSQREFAERQMFSALERSHKLDPKGNMVVTFHSSAGGVPPPEVKVWNPKTKKEDIKEIFTVDERSGQFRNVMIKPNYFKPNDTPADEIKRENEDAWLRSLQHVNFNADAGSRDIEYAMQGFYGGPNKEFKEKWEEAMKEKTLQKVYKQYIEGDESAIKDFSAQLGPEAEKELRERLHRIEHGDIYLRDAYQELQNSYNQAYDAALKSNNYEDQKKLETFRKELAPKLGYIKDPEKVEELAKEIVKGVHLLRSVKTPEIVRPLKDFLIDKSGETFGNIAIEAYKKFKDTAPIISIENPPAGVGGLTRADEVRAVVVKSRENFVKKAVKDLGLSQSEAEEQSKKLIGATWDVGHINMLRKYGYGTEEILEQTKTIAPFVKHVHLSDNFGYEHTELPMGMGNVPTKGHMDAISKYNKQVKRIIETGGNWYQFFQKSPLRETLEAFGSPVYGMVMGPYWNQASHKFGGYFAGYGEVLPQVNFQTYGAGFSTLPQELGGQLPGDRNRLSGAPMQ